MQKRVLVLGADGFIGRHVAFHLRAQGWDVLAHARRPKRLSQMGFDVLRCDLTSSKAADPEFWRARIEGIEAVVNTAGILNGTKQAGEAVHVDAPNALLQALPSTTPGVLVSAVGIETAETEFARLRLAGERVALDAGHTVLRAGLVLANTSYGGSSLARALASMPFATPVVGNGQQIFNPIHVEDLARQITACLDQYEPGRLFETGGPQQVTQAELLVSFRKWMGLASAPIVQLPVRLAKVIGRMGDAMRMGPISETAVMQLQTGVLAEPSDQLPKARGFHTFLRERPAGTQDLWHARLYLLRPLLRIVLAIMWFVSGFLGLLLPSTAFQHFLPDFLPDSLVLVLARFMGLADICIALALLKGWRLRMVAWVQGAVVMGYTLGFSILAPQLWALPLGGLLKNLPVLTLIVIHAILEEER